jgi:ABC-type multidrug transport system fused ATPase/permease subunit
MAKFMDISFWQTVLDRISNMFLMGPAITICTIGPIVFFVLFLRLKPAVAAVLMMNTQLSMRIVQAILHTVLIEGFMVSAQRLIQLVELPLEPAMAKHRRSTRTAQRKGTRVTAVSKLGRGAWQPSGGAIELRGVSMRYAPGLPQVLKGVHLKIETGQKVGIVGRTGAGKSSLVLAVFRMCELDGGSILIDGSDVSSIHVRELRAGLGMIPQDTFMFSGTIRANLDVTGDTSTDEELWAVLEQVSGLQVNIANYGTRSIRLPTCACACHFLHLDPIYHHIFVGSCLPGELERRGGGDGGQA